MDGALAEEALSPLPRLSPSSGWVDRRMDGRRAEHTHREVCVEVVLPVKQGPPVDVAVQGQAGHHGCFHTPPVEDLGGQNTRLLSDPPSEQTLLRLRTSSPNLAIWPFDGHQLWFCVGSSAYKPTQCIWSQG